MPHARRKIPDQWPRMMSLDVACAYCGISENLLKSHAPKRTQIGGRKLYDKKKIDDWLDKLGDVIEDLTPLKVTNGPWYDDGEEMRL